MQSVGTNIECIYSGYATCAFTQVASYTCLSVLQAARLLEQDDSLVKSLNGSGQTPLHVSSQQHRHSLQHSEPLQQQLMIA